MKYAAEVLLRASATARCCGGSELLTNVVLGPTTGPRAPRILETAPERTHTKSQSRHAAVLISRRRDSCAMAHHRPIADLMSARRSSFSLFPFSSTSTSTTKLILYAHPRLLWHEAMSTSAFFRKAALCAGRCGQKLVAHHRCEPAGERR